MRYAHQQTRISNLPAKPTSCGLTTVALRPAEEHEEEAEQVQAQVASGSEGAKQHDAEQADAEQRKAISNAVRERVFAILGDADRVDEIRNGIKPYRP